MTIARVIVIAAVFLFLGAAGAAGVLAFIPNQGSPPSVFDDFKWSSISDGYWHVHAIGGTARINYSILTLSGNTLTMERPLQTDPYRTVVVAKVKALHFGKFAIGLGAYESTAVSLEFDLDGAKCVRPTKDGTQVDVMRGWTAGPVNQWFYLEISLKNPYPYVTTLTPTMTKPVILTCSVYDSAGRLISTDKPLTPPTTATYPGIDEVNMHTWDSGNDYKVDWIYAGPESGNPLRSLTRTA